MTPKHEDFELVARHLDGESVRLTEAQKALARQIADWQRQVGPALDVAIPAGAMHRAHARLASALPARRAVWPRAVVAAAAVAAVIAVAILLSLGGDQPALPRGDLLAGYAEHVLNTPPDELDIRLELLAQEMADVRLQLALDDPAAMDIPLTGVEEEIGDLYLEDPLSGQGQLDPWEDSL